MADREIALIEEALPVVQKAIEDQTSAELVLSNTRVALLRLREIISLPIEGTEDSVKRDRLIGDMALGSTKLAMRAAEGEFRARQADRLSMLLEELAKITREG